MWILTLQTISLVLPGGTPLSQPLEAFNRHITEGAQMGQTSSFSVRTGRFSCLMCEHHNVVLLVI